MINPFNIKDSNRYTYKGRTVVVWKSSNKEIQWYYLDEFIASNSMNLHLSSRLWFILNMKKYMYA